MIKWQQRSEGPNSIKGLSIRLFGVFIFLVTGFANGADKVNDSTIENLLPQLKLSAQSQGSFTQFKHLKVLKIPIISNGQIIIAPELGLLWKTYQPIISTLRITEHDIFEIKDNALVAKSQQASKQFSRYLFAMFKGDWAVLSNDFILDFSGDSKSNWQVSLVPKSEQVKKLFTKITINGTTSINKISLFELSGNYTEIIMTIAPLTSLSEEDRGYFAL